MYDIIIICREQKEGKENEEHDGKEKEKERGRGRRRCTYKTEIRRFPHFHFPLLRPFVMSLSVDRLNDQKKNSILRVRERVGSNEASARAAQSSVLSRRPVVDKPKTKTRHREQDPHTHTPPYEEEKKKNENIASVHLC